MVGHASERSRRRRSEVDDVPRKVETEEKEPAEVDELDPQEPREPRRPRESGGMVESRLRTVIDELEVQERSEESVSQRMERAIGKLEEPEKPSRSTEDRLKGVIDELEEPVNDTEPELQKENGSKCDDLSDYEIDSRSKEVAEKLVNDSAPELQKPTDCDTDDDGKVRLESMEEIDLAVEQHPHVKYGLSPESYDTCEQYIRVISEGEEVSVKEIAEREELNEEVVESWREGVRPKPVESIEIHEEKRLEHEREVSKEALEHRIAPEEVHEVTKDALERENLSVKELSDIVYDIHQRIDTPKMNTVHYAELYDTGKSLTEDRLREISGDIYRNRETIQAELNKRLGFNEVPDHEVRIAVTDSRLYYWHINTSPDEWVNVLEDQKFYMSKEDKAQLIDGMRNHLHIRGGGQTSEYYLNDLMGQMSGLEDPAANRIRKYDSVYSFDGEVMHMVGDLQGKSLEDFSDVITHMGTKEAARVSNLHFPELGKFRMRFVGIAESDAHLDVNGHLSYYEKNEERMKIAIEFYQEFGDFVVKMHPTDKKRLDLPRLYGAMAEKWGIPRGDKAIHNGGLHDTVKHARLEDKPYYPREMVPEDGSVSGTVVSVTRHNVLHAGKKMEEYREKFGIEPVVTQEHIQFVIDEGTPQKEQLCYKEGDVIKLNLSKIQEIADDEKHTSSKIANDMLEIVYENKHQLLRDEADNIMKSLGIEMRVRESFVQYYRGSRRLALASHGATRGKDDAIRWVLIAPPNHPSKMKAAIELITGDEKRSWRIAGQIKNDGLSVDPLWEEYLK
ncbi:MAG: hypothetical protein RTV31_10375 [Candidatus Thorarchaeota archaeon]